MLVIFCFSHQAHSGRITEDYLGDANVPVRKFAHMFEYAVLAILYYRTLLLRSLLLAQRNTNGSANEVLESKCENLTKDLAEFSPQISSEKIAKSSITSSVNHLKPSLLALLMAIAYAFSDEWHQSFVPGRSATFSDVLVDTSGALIGLLLIWLGSRGRSAR